MLLALFAPAFAAPVAECVRPYSSAELLMAADAAEQRFAEQDPEGFASASLDVQNRLGCLADPLSPLDVVRVQRVMALGAFFAQDEVHMRAAVAAMVQVDIRARFPETVIPSGHKLDKLIDELAGLPHSAGEPLRTFSDGWIEVNGAYAPTVDSGVSATLQRLDNQGKVVETRYWSAGEPLGDWAGGAADAAAAPPGGKARPRGTVKLPKGTPAGKLTTSAQIAKENAAARHTALIVSGGAAIAATGVMYVLAADAKEQALDPAVPESRALAWRDQANGLTWGWIASSVVSGGLAATLAITW